MTKANRHLTAALLGVGLLFVSGCGGSSEPPSSSSGAADSTTTAANSASTTEAGTEPAEEAEPTKNVQLDAGFPAGTFDVPDGLTIISSEPGETKGDSTQWIIELGSDLSAEEASSAVFEAFRSAGWEVPPSSDAGSTPYGDFDLTTLMLDRNPDEFGAPGDIAVVGYGTTPEGDTYIRVIVDVSKQS